jgi:hypothetical protein
MDRPQLSVIVPTVGRASLERTLRSLLLQQSSLTWNCWVIGDSHAGTWRSQLDRVRPEIDQWDDEYTISHGMKRPVLFYGEHDGGEHCVGHPQRQYGMQIADGQWLSWLGDDDLYLPGAFESIRQAIELLSEPVPLLFRWISPWKALYWHTPNFYGDAPGHIDAECIVAPNIPEKLGTWGRLYQSDFFFIDETIKLHDGKVIYCPEIIAQARPSDAEDWTTQAQKNMGASA